MYGRYRERETYIKINPPSLFSVSTVDTNPSIRARKGRERENKKSCARNEVNKLLRISTSVQSCRINIKKRNQIQINGDKETLPMGQDSGNTNRTSFEFTSRILVGRRREKKFHPSTKVFNPEGGCEGSTGRGPDVSISIRKGDCI